MRVTLNPARQIFFSCSSPPPHCKFYLCHWIKHLKTPNTPFVCMAVHCPICPRMSAHQKKKTNSHHRISAFTKPSILVTSCVSVVLDLLQVARPGHPAGIPVLGVAATTSEPIVHNAQGFCYSWNFRHPAFQMTVVWARSWGFTLGHGDTTCINMQ